MKAVLTCVDYGDILALTLPYNRHHFSKVVVVTTPADQETIDVAKQCDCEVLETSDFYKNNARFNKWIPLERGLDLLGRDGVICIMDADVAWPKEIPRLSLERETLYSPRRHLWNHISLPPENRWELLPIHPVAHLYTGYTQIFHAEDSVLQRKPWFQSHDNAGGPDSVFQAMWKNKQRMPFKVLHIGPTETNWGGRITPKADGSETPGSINRAKELQGLINSHRNQFRSVTGK